MNIKVKQVTFKGIGEVAYGSGRVSLFVGDPEKKVTINFTVETDVLKLDGYLEMEEKEYIKNVSNLDQVIKDNLKL